MARTRVNGAPVAISIHAPRTGSDRSASAREVHRAISIHAPRTGSDEIAFLQTCALVISIHAPRTGSDFHARKRALPYHHISIHAPRTGSDRQGLESRTELYAISIHAPRTGSDQSAASRRDAQQVGFQSTLPARGATGRYRHRRRCAYFNPRSPHGERRNPAVQCQ